MPLATEIFDGVLGDRPNQKEPAAARRSRSTADQLRDLRVEGGTVTEAGVRLNVSVALQYLDAWLGGNGAAAINNLMEDAATAEISRSPALAVADDGDDARRRPRGLGRRCYRAIRDEEVARLGGGADASPGRGRGLLDGLVLDDDFPEFLTLRAYALLD